MKVIKFKETAKSNKINNARKIKAMMTLKGITGLQIAKREKVTKPYVSFVIHSRRRGQRIRRAIAAALHMKIVDLWPERGKKNN